MNLHFVMTFACVLMKGMCTYVFYLTCVKGIGLLKQKKVVLGIRASGGIGLSNIQKVCNKTIGS